MKALHSNGGAHVVAEHSSCFCRFYVSFVQRNLAVKGSYVLVLQMLQQMAAGYAAFQRKDQWFSWYSVIRLVDSWHKNRKIKVTQQMFGRNMTTLLGPKIQTTNHSQWSGTEEEIILCLAPSQLSCAQTPSVPRPSASPVGIFISNTWIKKTCSHFVF